MFIFASHPGKRACFCSARSISVSKHRQQPALAGAEARAAATGLGLARAPHLCGIFPSSETWRIRFHVRTEAL